MTAYRKLARPLTLVVMATLLAVAAARLDAQTGCVPNATPFTDLGAMPSVFCGAVTAAYFSGLTNGTSATTYEPFTTVNRGQMAAFITRTLDQSLRRGNRRAALNQWHAPTSNFLQKRTQVGDFPIRVACDGADLWVTNNHSNTISRVRASDGKLLETWTGATQAFGICVAGGRIYATGTGTPSRLYVLDPSQPAGPVNLINNQLGENPQSVTTDGFYIWTAGHGGVSRVSPDGIVAQTFTAGFTIPFGILYDGSNIWVTDRGDDTLKKLNTSGAVIQAVPVDISPSHPAFDGSNIWVPNADSNSVSVVRAATGQVIATLSGNGVDAPRAAAFDGQRILVTNFGGNKVSLWRATDLTPLGFYGLLPNSAPSGVCSDGVNFWVVLEGLDALTRF